MLRPGGAGTLLRRSSGRCPRRSRPGRARLTCFGFAVYEAALWVAPGFDATRFRPQRFALELSLPARAATVPTSRARSIAEMRRVDRLDAAQAQTLGRAADARVLPDVAAGDRMTGVHQPGAARASSYNGRPPARLPTRNSRAASSASGSRRTTVGARPACTALAGRAPTAAARTSAAWRRPGATARWACRWRSWRCRCTCCCPTTTRAQFGVPLAALGAVLLAARAFDAVLDPFIGALTTACMPAPRAAVLAAGALAAALLAPGFALLFFPPVGAPPRCWRGRRARCC